MPGLATPGGADTGILVDLAHELSTENFQHGEVRDEFIHAAFKSLGRATSGANGRKNLFWLAETFPPAATSDRNPGSRIAVYPISVLGLETDSIDADLNGNGVTLGGTSGTAALRPQADDRSSGRRDLRDSMQRIAAGTGAEAFLGTNDLAAALHKALADANNYYSLAYSPTNRDWNGHFRKINVQLAHHANTLFYRQGYLAVASPATGTP